MSDDGLVAFLRFPSVVFGLPFLFLVLLDLGIDASSTIELDSLLLRRILSLHLQPLILCFVLQTSRDLFDQPREVSGGLCRDRLNITLEDKEVARLDEDILSL